MYPPRIPHILCQNLMQAIIVKRSIGMSLRLEVVVPLSSCKILGLLAGMFDETQDRPDP